EHLGDQHQQQEPLAAPVPHPRGVVRGGQRHQQRQDGGAAGHQQGDLEVAAERGVRPDLEQVAPGEVVRQVVAVAQLARGPDGRDEHLRVRRQEDQGEHPGQRRDGHLPPTERHQPSSSFQRLTLRKNSTMTITTAKLTTAIAADSEMSVWPNMYMNTVEVAVSALGPPLVMPQISGNELKTLIRLMTSPTRNAGRSSGSVIRR